MEINVKDDRKTVEVWLTNQEKHDKALQERLETFYRRYTDKKYFIAVFMSGDQDLTEETSALLRYNRKRSAEQEVRENRTHASRNVAVTASPTP